MNKHTILFLAANPFGTDRLALDQEARAIQVELERSGHRDRFELVTRWAVQPLDLLRELRKLKPSVVHFSGHGGGAEPGDCQPATASRDVTSVQGTADGEHSHGLFFQGEGGRPQLVSPAALEETFGAAGASVKVVVLSACYSEVQAEALVSHIHCVVGVSGSIRDDAARAFSIGFYGGLGERQSVADAYLQGRAAILLEGIRDAGKPQLKVRNGVDAGRLMLSTSSAEAVSSEPSSEPLRFSAIRIAALDRGWCVRASEVSPFGAPADLRFKLLQYHNDADPLFDIVILNSTNAPIIVTDIGIEILRVAMEIEMATPQLAPIMRIPVLGSRGITASVPAATKIQMGDRYELYIQDIWDRLSELSTSPHDHAGPSKDMRQSHVEVETADHPIKRRWRLFDVNEGFRLNMPDPIYLEPRAPWRYGLRLRDYLKYVPEFARIRMSVFSDAGEYYSKEVEMYSRRP